MTEADPETSEPGDPSAQVARTVTPELGAIRLDVFLSQQPEFAGRGDAKALAKSGEVLVDGRPGKPGHYLKPGQIVEFSPNLGTVTEEFQAADIPAPTPSILFEDSFLLVIDKPAGLIAHPPNAARADVPSVSKWAQLYSPGLPELAGADRPGIVHRLDKETSGVMVLPKNEEAFHFLKGEFKARRVQKEYHAIAFGESRFQSDHIERNIATHPQKGDRMVVVKEGGRPAETYYEVRERFVGFTLFACFPKTGRTHQIRVHMTSVGHSLVADRFYRARNHASSVLPPAAPDPGRHCLHARRLAFRHPHTHQEMSFEADLPPDMAGLLDWLRQNRAT